MLGDLIRAAGNIVEDVIDEVAEVPDAIVDAADGILSKIFK